MSESLITLLELVLKGSARIGIFSALFALFCCRFAVAAQVDGLTSEQWTQIEAIEQQRIRAIEAVVGSVIAIYGENKEGGGSGVIIDPSGIALTNHHVIMGAGVSGWGGLADGNLYHWRLVGTDPGGDVAIIQMEGRDDFPFTWLADSDLVQPGDWALAMGNPFVLTEDQSPTVTLGIVSGVKRYQPGAGANQLVYGNCIQVDSSINPGNSGGPLFNLYGEIIGINGRGSFKDRGRVNVGLGYAISANQIKNFIPDLLATKLVEHGTLDASFTDRQRRVVCSTINRESPVAAAGLNLGDELLEFEGEPILSANQFTNLICTLPADWPAKLKIRKPNQEVSEINIRLLGLPYPKPVPEGSETPPPDQPDQNDEQARQRQAMLKLLSAPAGKVRNPKVNRKFARRIIESWKSPIAQAIRQNDQSDQLVPVLRLKDDLFSNGELIGSQTVYLTTDFRIRVDWTCRDVTTTYWFGGNLFYFKKGDDEPKEMSLVEAKLALPVVQALGMLAPNQPNPWEIFGHYLIDGSDKAQSQASYRMVQTDSDLDKFYFWLSVNHDFGRPLPQLLKASAEKNCQESGGVLFSEWQRTPISNEGEGAPWLVPLKRSFIKGLAEAETLKIVNRETIWLPNIDQSLFSPID